MFLSTAEQVRRADRIAIEERGIPARTLMENAGRGAFEVLKKYRPRLSQEKVVVIAGKGNNGGDGRVVARLLEGVVREIRVIDAGAGTAPLQNFDIVIDALFGTGLSRNVEGSEKEIIDAINASKKWVLSLDIPSGLSADTGKPLGAAVRANVTATMGLPKLGLALPEAAVFVGRMEVIDIGIPGDVYRNLNLKSHWITAADVVPFFRPRDPETHKGACGHLLLIGGSETKAGAILMAGRAALRAGAGLATVALPDKAFKKFPRNFLELMYEPQASRRSGALAGSFSRKALPKILKLCAKKTALAIGPGMGVNADTKAIVQGILKKTFLPTVLDADALNCIAPVRAIRRIAPTTLILTPHAGEMARLTGLTTAAIQRDRVGAASGFAIRHKVILVLKGFRTVIATPEGEVFINSTGNPGMATAGMGDVLTGVIGSFLAQGMDLLPAVISGVYLHGRAGDRVGEKLGDRGLLASDVMDEMPHAIHEILK